MSLSEKYLNNTSNWKGFDPRFSLNHDKNKNFISSLSKDIFENIFSSCLDKDMSFAILSIWDFKKKNLPQFQILFATDKKKEPIYINEIDWEKEELSIYKEYIKFLTEEKSGLHFWDLLHIYKKFSSKIRIHKDSEDRFLVDLFQSENKPTYELSKFIENFWLWEGGFNNNDYYKNKSNLKGDFIEIMEQYFNLLNSTNSDEFCIYEIPFLLNVEGNGENIWYRSVGSLSIGAKKPINNKVNKLVSNDLISIIGSIVSTQYKAVAQLNAVKSAIAAIMSRNISHNLGSHVLYYLRGILSSFSDLETSPFIVELEKNLKNKKHDFDLKVLKALKLKIKTKHVDEKDVDGPFLRGLSRFMGYLQERQDFIATLSNNYIPYFGSLNFKDFIYDALKPGLKIERHRADPKYKENNILLDYIAKSEGFSNNSININYKCLDLDDSDYFNGGNKGKSHLNELRKIELDLPGGLLGRQAFFSIIENFIRNSSKHNKTKDNSNIEVFIATQNYDEFFKFLIFDKFNNIKNSSLEILNKALNDKFINHNGELNPKYKGIKEMRISAAWLRGVDISEFDEFQKLSDYSLLDKNKKDETPINDKPILQIKKVDINGTEKPPAEIGSLCYEFFIPKVKNLLFISSSTDEDTNKFNSPKDGVFVKTYNEFIKCSNNYRLVIYDKESIESVKFIDDKEKVRFNDNKEQKLLHQIGSKAIYKEKVEEILTSLKDVKENSLFNLLFEKLYEYWIKETLFKENSSLPGIIIEDKKNYKDVQNEYNRSKDVEDVLLDNEIEGYKLCDDDVIHFYDETLLCDYISEKKEKTILFKHHNDNDNDFQDFKNTGSRLYDKVSFAEGISGHNSTDRLLRNEPKNKLWYLKMLETAQTKIAIIDERLFDENKQKETYTVDYTKEEIPIDSFESFDNFLKEKEHYLYDKIKNYREYDVIKRNFKTPEGQEKIKNNNLTDFYQKIKISKEPLIETSKKDFLTQQILRKKNIYLFNMDADLNVKDLSNNNIDVGNLKDKFHYIFIHQGIVDKFYSKAKVSSDEKKGEKFEEIRKKFSPVEGTGFKIIIHSGRSNPEFLPYNVAFSQFSSLDTAFNDCKYSLVQLAAASKYYHNGN